MGIWSWNRDGCRLFRQPDRFTDPAHPLNPVPPTPTGGGSRCHRLASVACLSFCSGLAGALRPRQRIRHDLLVRGNPVMSWSVLRPGCLRRLGGTLLRSRATGSCQPLLPAPGQSGHHSLGAAFLLVAPALAGAILGALLQLFPGLHMRPIHQSKRRFDGPAGPLW